MSSLAIIVKGVEAYAFSPDSRWILVAAADATARIWLCETGREYRRFEGHAARVLAVACSSDARQILTGSLDNSARLWDVASGREIWRAQGHQNAVRSVAFSPDGQTVLTASDDGTTGIWDRATGHELCRLVSFPDGSWGVLTPDGGFDTNRPDALPELHWVFPDEPFRTLPFEIFLRDNFEPRLLPRVLAREARRPLRLLADVNPVQPGLNLLRIAQTTSPDEVTVTVEATAAEGTYTRNNREINFTTAPHDVRIFRDGQLVARWPEPAESDDATPEPDFTNPNDVAAWREANGVPLKDGKATQTFKVRLPRARAQGGVHGLRVQRRPRQERDRLCDVRGSKGRTAGAAAGIRRRLRRRGLQRPRLGSPVLRRRCEARSREAERTADRRRVRRHPGGPGLTARCAASR